MCAILVAAFAMGAYLGRMVDRRLAGAISAADRDDPHWRLDDLMAHREPVPDEENSALVVAEAVALMPENWPRSMQPHPGAPRVLTPEVENAFEAISKTPDNVRLDDSVAEVLRSELEKYDEALRLARSVADYRRGRHEIELGTTLLNTPLGETQAARAPARLLTADAAIQAHDGDLDGAIDSCRAILSVGRSIGDEPFLISQISRVAIGGVAMNTTRRVMGQGEPSNEALARLQELLLDELAQPLLLYGMRGERATMTELIRRVGAGELPISALSDSGPEFDPYGPRPAIAPWGRLMFDNQRAVALDWMNEAVAIARERATVWPERWKAWEAEIDRVRHTWHAPLTTTLPILLAPALSASSKAHLRYQCDLGSTAMLLAAERHRRKHGDWPESIDAIDKDILPNPPADPFTGKSSRMERRDGQLLVYSVGPNLKDEHGAYDVRKWAKGVTDDDVGACAWDVPLRRQPPPAN